MRLEKILLSADASAEAEHARSYAGAVARHFGAQLDVVERGVERFGPASVADFAKETNCGLIVQSARRRSDLCRWVVGSFAEQTVRHSLVPVLTVPEGVHPDGHAAGPLDEFPPRRILCPFDLSTHSLPVLRQVARWAAKLGATVNVLYVADGSAHDRDVRTATSLTTLARLGIEGFVPDPRDALFAGNLSVVVDGILGDVPHESRIAYGDVHDVIVDAIRDQDIDLVAMGVQLVPARLRRWRAVTERVLRDVACPVLSFGIPQVSVGVEDHAHEEDSTLSDSRVRREHRPELDLSYHLGHLVTGDRLFPPGLRRPPEG